MDPFLRERPLEASWAAHSSCAAQLHKGIADLGLEFYCPNPADRLPTVTTIKA